jgi:hypothetical protein
VQITIGNFDPATNQVPVTFDHAGIVHERTVNACLDEAGNYDEAATAARVDDVARGVEHKIAVGAITEPEPPLADPAGE